MKKKIIEIVVIGLLGFFAVLYIVKPRIKEVIVETTVERIVREIPDEVSVNFGEAAPPDTTYPEEVEINGSFVERLASKKKFTASVLGDGVFTVESTIIGYSIKPIDLFYNETNIFTDKEKLSEYLKDFQMKKKCNILVPVLVGIVIGGTIVLIAI